MKIHIQTTSVEKMNKNLSGAKKKPPDDRHLDVNYDGGQNFFFSHSTLARI